MPADAVLDTAPLRPRSAPARAVRIGTPPRPRVRPLGDVLAELVRPALPAATETVAPVVVAPARQAPRDDPETHVGVVRLLQAVVEVLDGVRPAAHLHRVCDGSVLAAAVLAHVVPAATRRSCSRLRGVRVCAVAPGPHAAVEAAGVVHRGSRARALAARLEHDGSTWRFTALTIL